MNLSRFPYTFVIASCAVLPTTRSDRTLHPRDASNRIHAQSRTAGNFTLSKFLPCSKLLTIIYHYWKMIQMNGEFDTMPDAWMGSLRVVCPMFRLYSRETKLLALVCKFETCKYKSQKFFQTYNVKNRTQKCTKIAALMYLNSVTKIESMLYDFTIFELRTNTSFPTIFVSTSVFAINRHVTNWAWT